MDLRWLCEADRTQVKSVWRTCFGDSDSFIDEYFTSAARYGDGLGLFEDGRLLSDLFMLDFGARLSLYDSRAYFLAGCATMPEARNKNLMKKLIKRALLYMEEDGRAVTYLHPFLHSFYRKFGYATVSYVRRFEVPPAEAAGGAKVAKSLDGLPVEKLYGAYSRYVEGFDDCFIRSAERFTAWLRLLFSDGGGVVYEDGNEPAYALYYEEDETYDFIEAISPDESRIEALLSCAGPKRLRYFMPARAGGEGVEEFTMMRVVNPFIMLKRYTYRGDASFVIRVEDPFLERDCTYAVDVRKNSVDVRPTDAAFDIGAGIEDFAVMVTGAYRKEPSSGVLNVFPEQSSCYFETY